jgi:DNA-binding PadR family transcriptional regulator
MAANAARENAGKAMRSPIYWALLGLVIERPSYGLELANRFERVYADVLHISGPSHVYPAIDTLKGRGLIEVVPGTEVGRQPKTQYRATPFGVRSYEERLVAHVDEERRRQELWVRELGVFAGDPAAALGVIGRFERRYLERAGQIGRAPEGSIVGSRAALIDELVAERHRLAAGGMLSWFRFAQEMFEGRAGKPAGP